MASSSFAGLISNPEEFDVLCGKDNSYSKGSGNQALQALIDRTVNVYSETESKHEKTAIIKQIISTLKDRYGSRFLKPLNDGWFEISDIDAHDKVSHALRFKAVTCSIEGSRKVKSLRTDFAGSDRPRKQSKGSQVENESCSNIGTLFERQQQILGTLAVEEEQSEVGAGSQSMESFHATTKPIETQSVSTEAISTPLESESLESILREPLYDDLDITEAITPP